MCASAPTLSANFHYAGFKVSTRRAAQAGWTSAGRTETLVDQNLASGSPVFLKSGESIMKQISKYLSALFLAVTLMSVVGCASTAKQEGTGEYIDDSVITTKVKASILDEPTLKVFEINVETFKGVVQLSGFVSSQAAVSKASDVARGVHGVKSVKNDLRLK
jgi:hyperosmotically inducible protein